MREEGSNKPRRFLAILIISLLSFVKREVENKKPHPMDETFDEIDTLFSSFVEVLNAADNSSNKLILISTITDFLAFRAIHIAKF